MKIRGYSVLLMGRNFKKQNADYFLKMNKKHLRISFLYVLLKQGILVKFDYFLFLFGEKSILFSLICVNKGRTGYLFYRDFPFYIYFNKNVINIISVF